MLLLLHALIPRCKWILCVKGVITDLEPTNGH